MDEKEAREVFDGLMLGDAGLLRREGGVTFSMNLSKPDISMEDHLKYEQWVKTNVLDLLRVPACEGHPHVSTYLRKGKLVPYARLETRTSTVLVNAYNSWYRGGEWVGPLGGRYIHGKTKRFPIYFRLARELPVRSLVHLSLGDGCSSLRVFKGGKPKVYVDFSVCSFTDNEVFHLMEMLNNMGMATTKPFRDSRVAKGSGLRVYLSSRNETSCRFMDLVEPYVMEIFGDSIEPSYKRLIKRVPRSIGGR